MTISPPTKVKLDDLEPCRVLVCGVDTLYLAMDITWQDTGFFEGLRQLKDLAIKSKTPQPGIIKSNDGTDCLEFNVKEYGAKGYEWILENCDMTMTVGDWLKPHFRPSIYIALRSEVLWRVGVENTVARIVAILRCCGADIHVVKISRLDLCVDILLRESEWNEQLESYFVTKANKASHSRYRGKLTGFNIGAGDVSAVLYDKPAEITQKSGKVWMYKIWNLNEVPEGCKIIRVEFHLLREALKRLGIRTFEDLDKKAGPLWKYCTENWLKVQDNPGKHHTQRHTLDWWKVVQNGYTGSQGAEPLVRSKAIDRDLRRAYLQLQGNLTSIVAIQNQHRTIEDTEKLRLADWFRYIYSDLHMMGLTDDDLTERVRRKLAKYKRADAEKVPKPLAPREDFYGIIKKPPQDFVSKPQLSGSSDQGQNAKGESV